MKKTLLIIGGVLVALVAALVTIALYAIGKRDTELNRKKTEKARETRIANLAAERVNGTETQIEQDNEESR